MQFENREGRFNLSHDEEVCVNGGEFCELMESIELDAIILYNSVPDFQQSHMWNVKEGNV